MNKKQLIRVFKAIANPRRLEILLHLRKHKNLNVSGIAEKIDLSFRSTSRHLQRLVSADLVMCKQQSHHVFYFLSPDIPKVINDIFARISE